MFIFSKLLLSALFVSLLLNVLSAFTQTNSFNPAGKPYLYDPALSPNGAEITFVSDGDIWTVLATGGKARLLISHPATEARPLYSPNG